MLLNDQIKIQDGKTFKEVTPDGRRIYHKSMGNEMPKISKVIYCSYSLGK